MAEFSARGLDKRVRMVETRAATRAELEAVETDLPERSGTASSPTSGVPWFPGRRHFTERKVLGAPLDEVREATLRFLVLVHGVAPLGIRRAFGRLS